MELINPHIVTFTGRRVHIYNLAPDEINIIDIAHHLSLECRFTGATLRHYSVAEHSVLMCDNLEDNLSKKYALLHDASEYILKDVPRTLKMLPAFKTYKLLEQYVQNKIFRKYGLDPSAIPQEVVELDEKLATAEINELLHQRHSINPECTNGLKYTPRDLLTLRTKTGRDPRQEFLHRFLTLFFEHKNEVIEWLSELEKHPLSE